MSHKNKKAVDVCDHIDGFFLSDIVGAFGRPNGVVEQHGDGHWAYTTGNGGDGGGDFFDVFIINVANETVAIFHGCVFDSVDPHVDDHGAFFDHVGGDGVWITRDHNEDIGG